MEQYDLLKKLSDELSAGVLKYNFNTGETLITDSLEQLLTNCLGSKQISPEELIKYVPVEDKPFLQELFSLPKPSRKRISGQFRLTTRMKETREVKIFQVVANYQAEEKTGTSVTCYILDATKESKQLKDLQRNLDRSEESDRIKTNFLLNISHNIRTPMNSILGFAELLSHTDPEPIRRKEYLQVIKKQSKTLLQLIDNIAEIAKYESGILTVTKTPVNINLLLNDIIKEIDELRSASRKEHVAVRLKTPSSKGIEVYTDGGRLHQVLIYLVNHSLRYTTDGYIEIGYTQPEENRIEFYLRDTSPTVPRDQLRNVFDQFMLPDKSESGRYDDETGLGLSLAKSIVKLLGGKISAESVENQGLVFHFSLPYEQIPAQAQQSIDEELMSDQYKWADKVILIVEDEDVNALFLEAVFQETSAQTLNAKNGQQAIELCKSINKIDLILMDLKMPVMNGLMATQEIRKFNPGIPIIAQTALSLEEDRQNCLLAGCNDLISKPIEVEELLNLVSKYFS
ncbi:MAG: response regulator [Bacteroidales bacterium]|nr:response regulator [Bacteroidales bacterium]